MSNVSGEIVKITSIGTISIPKQFRRHLEMQKGDHIMIDMKEGHLVVRKVQIS
jgi:AbrB family looped-hinge helix DNA binding protein